VNLCKLCHHPVNIVIVSCVLVQPQTKPAKKFLTVTVADCLHDGTEGMTLTFVKRVLDMYEFGGKCEQPQQTRARGWIDH